MFPTFVQDIEQQVLQEEKAQKSGSVQGRANPHPDKENEIPGIEALGMFHIDLSSATDTVTPWSYYPARRDRQLRNLSRAEYLFAGATYSVQSRIRTLSWRIDAPGPLTKKRFQTLFGDADLGRGWSEFVGKLVLDLCTQDNGAFVEIVGPGKPDRPLMGAAQKVVHLDSALCWRTHDPEFPVIYINPYLNTYHKLHHSRVMMMSSNTQPAEMARGIGFCAVSRALRAIQIMRNISVYKDEKISGRFRRGIIYGNGLTPGQFKKSMREAEQENDSEGFAVFNRMPVILTQQPDMKLDILNLASVPDGFDWNMDTTLYIYAIALAYGVDAREFWPATVSGATKADAAVQHLKARGKGIGDIIQTLERGFNWSILPEGTALTFDYVDDEQDLQKAQLNAVYLDNIERGIRAGLLSPQEGKALAIALGIYDPKVLADVASIQAPNTATDTAPMDPNAQVQAGAITVPAVNTGANNVYSPLSGSSSQQPNDDADILGSDIAELRDDILAIGQRADDRQYVRDQGGQFASTPGGGGGKKKYTVNDRMKALLGLFNRKGTFKDGVLTVEGMTRDRSADIQKFLQTKGYKDAKVTAVKTENGMEYRIEGAQDEKKPRRKRTEEEKAAAKKKREENKKKKSAVEKAVAAVQKAVGMNQKDSPFDLDRLRAEMEAYEDKLAALMEDFIEDSDSGQDSLEEEIDRLRSRFQELQDEYTRRAAEMAAAELDDEAEEAIEAARRRNNNFFDDAFLIDMSDAVAEAIADGGVPELGAFISRIRGYGAPFWESAWLGVGSEIRSIEDEGYTVKVTRHLSGGDHCLTCPPKAGEYDSFESMRDEVGLPGDLSDNCKGRCRCYLTYDKVKV